MIEVLPASQSNRLGLRLSGKLTAEEREQVYVPQVEQRLESYGSIRLLLEIDEDFAGGERGAFDGAFLGRRIDRFEKVAVVGTADHVLPIKLASRQMKGEFRRFERDQAEEAWRWLEQ
jgi:hypothetical protein